MQKFLHMRSVRQQASVLHRLLQGPVSRPPATLRPWRGGPGPAPPRLTYCAPRCLSTSTAAWSSSQQKGSTEQPEKQPPQQPPQQPPSTQQQPQPPEEEHEIDPLQDKSIGLVQRFKKTFKQYGKVMIPVHLLTSSVWFGSFYYAAMHGVNVVPFLEYVGFPDKLVKLLENSQSGYALTAYAMYKIATPARYTVTLGGTSLSVRYLRKHGHLSTPPPVKEYIQEKMDETRDRFSEKMEETKDRFSEKMEETKDRFSELRFSERIEETKDKINERLQETKDKVAFRKKAE
ncbi:uncharacterized protein C18orf19 homolog A [Engraulis encrasicolus]|uniref:uncharacterized protein C18orf19 homolog A n=1 Tax=Engraulis encrasicolus TaxID=184585 RepID=UPI002FD4D7A0